MDTKFRTLDEFASELAEQLEKNLYEEYGMEVSAEPHFVRKTNIEKQGITIRREDTNVAPTVYVDDAYARYTRGESTIQEIAFRLCDSVIDAMEHAPTLPEFNREEAIKHVTLTLVNTELNRDLLEFTPHYDVVGGELSVIPRWYIDDDASFVVNNDLAAQMDLTPDEILQIGQNNIKAQRFEVKSMNEILAELIGADQMDMLPPMDGPQMIVISNERRMQGSNALLSDATLNRVHDMIGDFVVLPSSIHEVICVPITDDMKPDDMRAMVHEVNMSQVAPEERLSDQIFKYDGQKLSLVHDSLKMATPEPESLRMEAQKVRMTM